MILDFTKCRIPPFRHQEIGIHALVEKAIFALFDEMGAGKTKQVIDAAQFLFLLGIIDRVIVVAPATVRSVWFDKQIGELAKHLWMSMNSRVTEYHARLRQWRWDKGTGPELEWVITNYDFLRSKNRLNQLLPFATPKTLLVLDESSYVKNSRTQQAKVCLQLRRRCGRVVLLNGTPITQSPLDMFSQGQIMDPTILACSSFVQCRARYAIIVAHPYLGFPKITGYQNLDDLQRRFAPYVLRRMKKDCLDLPEKLPPVPITVTLTPETWKIYTEMRDEFCAWLDQQTLSTAPQAVTKALRLAQVTSGFLGGLETLETEPQPRPDWVPTSISPPAINNHPIVTRYFSFEKIEALLNWHKEHLEMDPNFKLIVSSRFRPEVERIYDSVHEKTPFITLGRLIGDMDRNERDRTLRLLDPQTAPEGPVTVIATSRTGSLGLNFTAAHTVVYMSHDPSVMTRMQSEDRIHRPGQVHAVSYFDMVAVGPHGQRTIDQIILAARSNAVNLATWTADAWKQALMEE